MQVFTIVKNVTGEGEILKTEYQIAGNVTLLEAQQMLTEAIIATSKAQGSEEAKERDDGHDPGQHIPQVPAAKAEGDG